MKLEQQNVYANRATTAEHMPPVANASQHRLLALSQTRILAKRANLQSQENSRRDRAYKNATYEGSINKVMNIVNSFQPVEMY